MNHVDCFAIVRPFDQACNRFFIPLLHGLLEKRGAKEAGGRVAGIQALPVEKINEGKQADRSAALR